MSSNIIGIYCPACDRQQIDSLMRKTVHQAGEGMMVSCTVAQHRYSYERLMALNPRKQKIQFTEKQPVGSSTQQFWIHPEALNGLRARWPENTLTTLYSLFNALADGETFLVEGEYARELAAATPPITKGREVAGMLHTIAQLRAQIVTLEERLKHRVPASTSAPSDPRMDAIIAALVKSGIEIPILPAPAPAPSNLAGVDRDPFDVDYREGDLDPNEQLVEPATANMGTRIPISNYRG